MILEYIKTFHENSLWHGSLNIKNIWVKTDYTQIKVTDFQNCAGTVWPMSSLNETKFQSPHIITSIWKQSLQATGDLNLFLAFDLWSVGMILFELFSMIKFERLFYEFFRKIDLASFKEY